MKKRILAALLALVTVFVFAACSQGNPSGEIKVNDDGTIENGYVKVNKYKGIEVTVEPVEVTEDEIASEMEYLISANPIQTEVDRPAENGDTILMDYVGKIDGVAFEGGTATDAEIVIGNNNYIDGFGDGLIGVKKGERRDLNLTFPSDYHNATYAGKAAVFEVTVKSVSIKETVSELTDEFVASVTEYKTVAEYKEYITELLRQYKENLQHNQKVTDIWDKVLENTELIKMDDARVQKYIDENLAELNSLAANSNVTAADYVQTNYGQTYDEFLADLTEYCTTTVLGELAAEAIAAAEGLEITDAEYNQKLKEFYELNYSAYYNTLEEFAAEFEAYYTKEYVRFSFLFEEVLAVCEENAVVA